MKIAIIIHGVCDDRAEYEGEYSPPKSNSYWYSWVAGKLCLAGILTQRPEMPHPYFTDMNYDEWAETFANFKIDEDTILIGHSAGGGFLLKYMSLHPELRAGQLILVAPFIDPTGLVHDHDFMKGALSDQNLLERIGRIDLFYSMDDMDVIQQSVSKIRAEFAAASNMHIHEFANKGHFCSDDMGIEFPEILEVIK
jgi:predicted alpha/beta hydrolase family esterase